MKKRYISMITITALVLVLLTNSLALDNTTQMEAEEISYIVELYYEKMYNSFISLELETFGDILDMSIIQNVNKVNAIKENIFSNQYVKNRANDYIGPTKEPYTILFDQIEIVEDMAIVETRIICDNAKGVYPFFIDFGQNVFTLKNVDSTWKIIQHDYAGLDFFEKSTTELIVYDYNAKASFLNFILNSAELADTELYENEELGENTNIARVEPYTDYSYSANRAIAYADEFVYTPNSYFYEASNDCANFVSQCVAYGFGSGSSYDSRSSYRQKWSGSSYEDGWYGHGDGGSSAWESTDGNWNYMTKSKGQLEEGPRVTRNSARLGSVVQFDWWSDNDYDHSAIIVGGNSSNWYVAQHNRNGYRYLNNYTGVGEYNYRFYYPSYYRVFE